MQMSDGSLIIAMCGGERDAILNGMVLIVWLFLLLRSPVRYTVASPPSLRFVAGRSRAQAYIAPNPSIGRSFCASVRHGKYKRVTDNSG
jgi:hypothetical protein